MRTIQNMALMESGGLLANVSNQQIACGLLDESYATIKLMNDVNHRIYPLCELTVAVAKREADLARMKLAP